MVFARIWHRLGGRRRQPTSAQMFRQAQRLRDDGRFELGRVLEAPVIPEALRLSEHLGARRLPPPAPEPVPDSREDHGSILRLSKSSPRGFDAPSRLPCRVLDEDESPWHGTTLTELVIETDQLSRRAARGGASSP